MSETIVKISTGTLYSFLIHICGLLVFTAMSINAEIRSRVLCDSVFLNI